MYLRGDIENARLSHQATTMILRLERHFSDFNAMHVRNSIVRRQPTVEHREIRFHNISHAEVFLQQFIEDVEEIVQRIFVLDSIQPS